MATRKRETGETRKNEPEQRQFAIKLFSLARLHFLSSQTKMFHGYKKHAL